MRGALAAFAEIVRNNKDREAIYRALMRMANVEGVILEPLEPDTDDTNQSKEDDNA